MSPPDQHDRLFVAFSLGLQVVLVIFFALRTWDFPAALQVGWLVYALGLPAVVLSVVLSRAGKAWSLVAAGLLFGLWAAVGTVVDLVHPIAWRSPIAWPVFVPYVFLYTASQMFYWWPLLRIHRPSWLVFTALYIASTFLNVTSH